MCHSEGGWPKDLNIKDTEQIIRYKRKIEKDELYIHTMLQLLPVFIFPFTLFIYKSKFYYKLIY